MPKIKEIEDFVRYPKMEFLIKRKIIVYFGLGSHL
jgi:hypothetical protein